MPLLATIGDQSIPFYATSNDQSIYASSSISQNPSLMQTDVIASVIVIQETILEVELANMKVILENLKEESQEKDAQIATLTKKLNKISNNDSAAENSSEDTDAKSSDDEVAESLSADQIKEIIEKATKCKISGTPNENHMYIKPYTRRKNNLKMPPGYKPPKFYHFDDKGNPKQHIAHFVETCNNAGTEGDLLVKQFFRSLKGIAFDWYTD
ncbi:hypothetical protein RND81_09G186800 [Saponaria officinalis]|uniref:Retrotransposon gag protein n=1 Tax=Saponaria officinalis TaxID=3572 RepID=A0AAW1IMN7_SAPOF